MLSVTVPSVPWSVASTTVSPPELRLLPFASFSWTVMVDVLEPSATIEAGEAAIVEVDADGVPEANVTVALPANELPLSVPVIVAVPTEVEDVSVAVYVPSL